MKYHSAGNIDTINLYLLGLLCILSMIGSNLENIPYIILMLFFSVELSIICIFNLCWKPSEISVMFPLPLC